MDYELTCSNCLYYVNRGDGKCDRHYVRRMEGLLGVVENL